MEFKEYLISKNIDSSKFKLEEGDKYATLESQFDEMHPDSFTAQKLFLINPIRRKYILETEKKQASTSVKTKFKPKIR